MTDGPAVDSPGEEVLEDDKDTTVLRVVVDQGPVQFASSVVFPASLAFKNLSVRIYYSSKYDIIASISILYYQSEVKPD